MNIQKITGESIQGLKKAAKNISDGTPPKMIEDGGEKMAKGMDAIANSGMAHVITRKKEDFESFIKAAEEVAKRTAQNTNVQHLGYKEFQKAGYFTDSSLLRASKATLKDGTGYTGTITREAISYYGNYPLKGVNTYKDGVLQKADTYIDMDGKIFKESFDYTDIEDLKRMGGVPRRIYEIGDGKTREIDFRKEPLLETRLSPALHSPFYNKD